MMKVAIRTTPWVVAATLCVGAGTVRGQDALSAEDSLLAARIYEELVDIPSVSGTPAVGHAAETLAGRLREAGFPEEDLRLYGGDSIGRGLVARYRGTGARPPVLLMAHIDVVPADSAAWATDPFTLVEKDGWWYARGTSDNKAGAAILVTNLIRWKRAGYRPDRDLVVVLTGDEETTSASIRWLVGPGRELIGDPAFALNTDAGGGVLEGGEERLFTVQASEKVYLTFLLETAGPGGHSSRPLPDNAIDRLAAGLTRLVDLRFPVALNEVTRGYFEHAAELERGSVAADMRAVAASPPDTAAARRLSAVSPYYNALLRTTCVATRLQAGHADNALPQSATATVNCRILPDESPDDVERAIVRTLADERITVRRARPPTASPPSPLRPEVMGPITETAAKVFPGVQVVPEMSTGATDGLYLRNAGIPVYGVAAIFEDPADDRAHGRDERMAIGRFYEALRYWDLLARAVAR